MKKTLVALLIGLSLLSVNKTNAQLDFGKNGTFANKWYQGELVLHNGDTLKGLIKFESALKALGSVEGKMRKIFYKKNEDDKKTKYKKEDFSSFTVTKNNGVFEKYATVYVSEKRMRILKVITEGEISLYEIMYAMNYSSNLVDNDNCAWYYEYQNLYIKRSDEKVASNEFFVNAFKSFDKTAKNYFSDCPELVKKIDDGDFDKEGLFEIVEHYNSHCR